MKIDGKTNQRFGTGGSETASPGGNREGEMTRYQIIATRSPANIFGAAQEPVKSNGLSVIYDRREDAEAHAERLNKALRKSHMNYTPVEVKLERDQAYQGRRRHRERDHRLGSARWRQRMSH